MTTIGEMIQRVQSQYSKGVHSKDSRLTSRHIYSSLLSARSILFRQLDSRKSTIGDWSYQTLPCAELIKAPIHECAGIPGGGVSILRTKYQIPKIIEGTNGPLIRFVGTLDASLRIDDTKFENIKYSSGNKYTGNKPNWFQKNGYIYVTKLTSLRALPIIACYYDPLEAYLFPNLCETNCNCNDATDYEFPIDGTLIKPLIDIANQEVIVLFKQMTEDRTSNAIDDGALTGTMVHQPQNNSNGNSNDSNE